MNWEIRRCYHTRVSFRTLISLSFQKDDEAAAKNTLGLSPVYFSPGKQASPQQEEGIGHLFQRQIVC